VIPDRPEKDYVKLDRFRYSDMRAAIIRIQKNHPQLPPLSPADKNEDRILRWQTVVSWTIHALAVLNKAKQKSGIEPQLVPIKTGLQYGDKFIDLSRAPAQLEVARKVLLRHSKPVKNFKGHSDNCVAVLFTKLNNKLREEGQGFRLV
jgi:hypothetical protein